MKEKSCKLYINIVFLIILTITIFGGNKVMGAPTESQQIKQIPTDSNNYNYYSVNDCGGGYYKQVVMSSNGGPNVSGCVPMPTNPGTDAPNMSCSGGTKTRVVTTTNTYVWICRAAKSQTTNPNGGNLKYTANVSAEFYNALIDSESCSNSASIIATFNSSSGSRDVRGCMYDGQGSFSVSCPAGSSENLLNISDNYGSVYSFKVCTKTTTDSGDDDQSETLTTEPEDSEEITPPTINGCKSLLGDPTKAGDPSYYIVFAFKVVRYVAIILLIVLSVVDLVGAVASSDSEILNKTVAKIFKRFIFCIIIFLLPMLIQFVLHFINENYTVCGVGE